MTRRLRVLAGHPHLGQPNDQVREFEGAQAYVDAGFAEWIDDGSAPAVVDRSAAVETTDGVGGAVETTTVRTMAKSTAAPAGAATVRRRGHAPADD